MGTLRLISDSSLPRPHPNQVPHVTHIGRAVFHSRTAFTGVDLAPLALIFVALVCIGLAALIAVRHLEASA